MQKQNNGDFFIQFFYDAWLHLTNNNFSVLVSIEETLDQSIFLNPHTKLDSKHPTQEYLRQTTIIRDLCRSLQPGLTTLTIFRKKLDFPAANHKRYMSLLWAQFSMIGNTYLELKLLKNRFKIFSATTIKSLGK